MNDRKNPPALKVQAKALRKYLTEQGAASEKKVERSCTCGECDPTVDPRFTGRDLSHAPLSQELREKTVKEMGILGVSPEEVGFEAWRSCFCRGIHWRFTLSKAVPEKEGFQIVQHFARLWKTSSWHKFGSVGFVHLETTRAVPEPPKV